MHEGQRTIDGIHAARDEILAAVAAHGPRVVIGVTGAVASGKSTLARALSPCIVSTDHYLPDYDATPEHLRDLPESSDLPRLAADLAELRAGEGLAVATTLFGGLPSSNLEVFLQALDENRYVRLLAEPNLVAVSGGEATFLVGGEFPVPIVQGASVGTNSVVTVQYKEFGVRLNFRPQVLGEGRIRLEVSPEVSELSEIGSLQQNGFTVPGIVTRRSSTTVELGTGQSFAMAGLLRSKEQARRSSIPLLGDLPVLGALFRSMRYEQEETELVVIVTAELVEPLDRVDTALPGEFHVPPSDWQLFLGGRIGGAAARPAPNPRLRALGLDGLHGPGAWRRTDDARLGASEDTAPQTPPAPPAEGERK